MSSARWRGRWLPGSNTIWIEFNFNGEKRRNGNKISALKKKKKKKRIIGYLNLDVKNCAVSFGSKETVSSYTEFISLFVLDYLKESRER